MLVEGTHSSRREGQILSLLCLETAAKIFYDKALNYYIDLGGETLAYFYAAEQVARQNGLAINIFLITVNDRTKVDRKTLIDFL